MSFVDANYFSTHLKELPIKSSYTKSDLLINTFRLKSDGDIEIFYSPHNEYINVSAKVILVGITPGWQQMEIAYRTAIHSLQEHKSYEEACKQAKMAARFAGTTRTNLIEMLQEIGIHSLLRVQSAKQLFDPQCTLLHTTSLIRYPVFVSKQNYNGHKPSLIKNAFLNEAAMKSFLAELAMLENPLIIPLGKSVESYLMKLIENEMIENCNIMWGFPHPSGANGHRLQQFESAKDGMKQIVSRLLKLY